MPSSAAPSVLLFRCWLPSCLTGWAMGLVLQGSMLHSTHRDSPALALGWLPAQLAFEFLNPFGFSVTQILLWKYEQIQALLCFTAYSCSGPAHL